MEKKTALYEEHIRAGGRMVPFAGYLLPVQYESGIRAEHEHVRTRAGLFDVSHMGEFLLEGKDALSNINNLLTNDFSDMKEGHTRYSPMCYDNGGTVDDLLIYKCADERYYAVVNAANKEKDYEWIKTHLAGEVRFEDVSEDIAQVALQGPNSAAVMEKMTEHPFIPEKYYTFVEKARIGGMPCLISKTGYTGELGYEIYCRNEYAQTMWDMILEAGKDFGVIPCGLGARDTLRLEAAMPLYGHELAADISPKEAGLFPFIRMEKRDFIGKEALSAPRTRKRIGLKLVGRGIAREGMKVFSGGMEIGFVTSGTLSPTLGAAIAMALVSADFDGRDLLVEIRGKGIEAQVVEIPFYRKKQ